ncbi:MAG TPA: TIGR03936 family radical SAM-associated protein [Pirellulales bacterium]|jgi:radical SAM-linked protein|nr:TIGR03936 family radical SAM-associated protein [Pirellulales bacterium]
MPTDETQMTNTDLRSQSASACAPSNPESRAPSPVLIRQRVRIRFTKQGDLRWLSHRDLMRTWERLFRRAAVPLGMTEGFHPKPRMNFPSALAVGIAGDDEMLEVELSEAWAAERLQDAIAAHAPPGLEVTHVEVMPPGSKKAQAVRVAFEAQVPEPRRAAAAERIAAFLSMASCEIGRAGRSAPLDLRPLVEELSLVDGTLKMRLRVDREGSARPREVLAAVGLEDLELEGCPLTRTEVEIC